jgi:hypothetical protein
MSRRRKWIVALGLGAVLAASGLAIAASLAAKRIEPLARQTAIRYLSERFDCDVELQSLHVHLPQTSLWRVILARGKGSSVRVEGAGLSMRLRAAAARVSLFRIHTFSAEVNLDSLWQPPVFVSRVVVDGMEIQVPPRAHGRPPQPAAVASASGTSSPDVIVANVIIRNASLVLQPGDPRRLPLQFDIQSLQLKSVKAGAPMKYDASLVNAGPPGNIYVSGGFGPWRAGDPGETPIGGDYLFENADLGVFAGIAGTLDSTGHFEGELSALKVRGEAKVPDFRLRISNNALPLRARFTALVDGTNGNTVLQPVEATLGSTRFTTSGGIIRHEADQPRAISLTMSMPDGDLRDVLRLAMKGAPFMDGRLTLDSKIDIPPLTGKVREKLMVDGRFTVLGGKFLHSTIQNQIEAISKRAQGNPQAAENDAAVSHMYGAFHMEDAAIRFSKLSFGFPGANLDLAGDYSLNSDAIDFAGALKLQATVSHLVTGWKSLLLRPVDRFFEKGGAGTYLNVRVEGTSKAPKLGVIIAGREITAPLNRK